MKSIRVNKNWVKDFENAQTQAEELQVFYDFYKEGDVSDKELQSQFDMAQKIIEKQDRIGWWPNDAIMCRQLCEWLYVFKPYFTKTQGIKSTTSK